MVEKQGNQAPEEKQGRKPWTLREFGGKTLWDWLQLFIVPLVLVGIGLLFEMQQANRQQAMEEQQQALEERRAEGERNLAKQRAQDEALQAYLSQMSSLLLEKALRASDKRSEVRTLARARTLTVLGRLDPSRKADIIQFLVEADLVQRADGRDPIIGLSGADLSGANLSEADLSYANLFDANLSYANLSYANLLDAEGITDEELEQQAASLASATMPNGQKYEEWLKDKKAQGKDENE
jgi:uncharacterized protein YjbI with pentapeptide repeats